MEQKFYLGLRDEMELIKNNIKVSWINIGEGYFGDYDSEDPEDENLLRFEVYMKNGEEWDYVEDSSRCTYIAANTPKEKLEELLESLMNRFYDVLHSNPEASVKHLADELSRII